ncbi:MAG: CCA tRNA nucleotidyltransferase, partial [Bacteroidota bacterium]|nr:CCA tRNA nucleotidyltransferase [Bacteroidota bacterium]
MDYKEDLDKNPIFLIVKEAASALNIKSFVIGGFVRDLLLKRTTNDIDIVCLGSGIELAQKTAEIISNSSFFNCKVSFFKNFGTAMLHFEDLEIEIVGARKESYKRNSRKPIVEDGTLEDDQNRRDFTINTMAISLNNEDYGQLIDPFEGVEDLRRKIIKTPLDPEITFSDDPLRILRGIRFASQLNFDIAPDTFDAIIKNKNRLEIVSQERIIEELNKIILSPVPSYGFKLLFQAGVLHLIFPEMVALQGVEIIDKKGHKDNFYHTLQVLDNVAKVSDDLWLRWAAILHDIAKPVTKKYDKRVGWSFHGHEDKGARMVSQIFRKMKLPLNEKMKFVEKLVKLHLRPIALVKEDITDSAIRRLLFEAGNDIEALMKLCRADITSKNDSKVVKYLQNFDKVEKKMVEVEEKDHLRNFQPALTGEDIMKIFNLKPSKTVGELKDALKEAILEGHIRNSFDDCYKFLVGKANE